MTALPLATEIDRGDIFLTDLSVRAPEALIAGLLHRSTKAVLGGSSKAGKTWVLLDLALSVATGTPFLKWETTQGKVLFLNLEIPKAFFKERILSLMTAKGLDQIGRLDCWNLRGAGFQPVTFLAALADQLKNEDYALIVIDPVYKLMTGRSENSGKSMGQLCHGFDRLASKTGAAVVYAHHFTKGRQSGKRALDRLSGSSVLARDADTIITMTEHRLEGCYVVETTQRNMPSAEPFVVEWNSPTMVTRNDLDPEEIQGQPANSSTDTSDFLLNLVADRPQTTTEWEAAAARGSVSRATFYRLKAKLLSGGDIVQDPGSDLWHLPGRHVARANGETCETCET